MYITENFEFKFSQVKSHLKTISAWRKSDTCMIEKQQQLKKLVNRIRNSTIIVHYILKLRRCDVIRVSIEGIDKVFTVVLSFLLVTLWYTKKSGLRLHNLVALKVNYPTKKKLYSFKHVGESSVYGRTLIEMVFQMIPILFSYETYCSNHGKQHNFEFCAIYEK